MNLLADSIKRAGSTDKKAVAAALKAPKNSRHFRPRQFTDKNLLARSNFVVLVVKTRNSTLPNNRNHVRKQARAAGRRGFLIAPGKGGVSDDF